MGTVYTPNSNQVKHRCEICGKIFEISQDSRTSCW